MPHAVAFTLSNDLTTGDMARLVFQRFGPPYVVKPASEGASHGIGIALTLVELPDALGDVLDAFGSAIVEEFVRGHDVSVGVIENFRNEELYVLPPAHMVAPKGSRYIDSQSHRDVKIIHVVPSNFSHEEKQALIDLARAAHRALQLSHYSRADMMLTPRGPYLLEVNSTPGLYPGASFPPMLESVGSSVREFLEHAIHLAKGQ
jgi:D-alanine-D-alanine ligase